MTDVESLNVNKNKKKMFEYGKKPRRIIFFVVFNLINLKQFNFKIVIIENLNRLRV